MGFLCIVCFEVGGELSCTHLHTTAHAVQSTWCASPVQVVRSLKDLLNGPTSVDLSKATLAAPMSCHVHSLPPQLKRPVDIGLSHDWPRGVARHGDLPGLLRAKSFLQREVCRPPCTVPFL